MRKLERSFAVTGHMRWLWLSLVLVACGTASEDVSTSTAPVLAAEEAADAGPGPTPPVDPVVPLASVDDAPLAIPGPARTVAYSPDAPFTALSFVASVGQDIAFLVDSRTDGAKPVVWITDNQFVSIAANASVSGSAWVRFRANRAGIFHLVLREATAKPTTFRVRSFDFTP